MATPESIVDIVTKQYLKSRDFNGYPIRLIEGSPEETRAQVEALVRAGKLNLECGLRHPNPHILALEPRPAAEQLTMNADVDLNDCCLYPTRAVLASAVSPGDYADRPFTRALALGEHQLSPRFFELKILETYRSDPRYSYWTDDIQGSISIGDTAYRSAETAPRDKVLLQQFGFGYDRSIETRVVAVLMCDLSKLTPEHQQIWAAHELRGDYAPHPGFWDSVMGHWGDKVSIFQAFLEELQAINAMARLMGREPLFREDFSATSRPREFGFLIRPTLSEFNAFVHLLDKIISENINPAFFKGEIPMEVKTPQPDGTVVKTNKGTITAFQEWTKRHFKPREPESIDELFATLRRVRKLRQKPAHAINENEFDQKYFREQRQLVIDAYNAIRAIRLIFANHPLARKHEVPEWLQKGDIWTR